MKRFSSLLLLFSVNTFILVAQPYPEHNIYDTDLLSPSFFRANRQKLLGSLGDSVVVILYSAGEHTRNNDVDYMYRQDDDFFYMTGCNEPNSVAIFSSTSFEIQDSSGKKTPHEILLVDKRNPLHESWEGKRLGPEGAMNILGFEYSLPNELLASILWRATSKAKTIYIPLPPEESKEPLSKFISEINSVLRYLQQSKTIASPVKAIRTMRDTKQQDELALMQSAVALTLEGHKRMFQACKPGMYEYQLQAEFEYAVKNGGGEFVAYPCIVGASENSVILHYQTNRRKLNDGDVIVMDCGAEYHNYACDVTRTIPVNGKFSKEQREIYDIVLEAQEEAMKEMKPGVKYFEAPTRRAREIIRDGLLRLGIIKDSSDYRKFFIHGLGHPVGLAVHDVGIDGILRPNQVWTVEPGIYIPANSEGVDPKYWNIGVRIEDQVLVTETGVTVMSAALPKKAEEVERMMKDKH